MSRAAWALASLCAVSLAGCASLPGAPPRAAATPLACMRVTVAKRVPVTGDDKLRHCLAAGLRCAQIAADDDALRACCDAAYPGAPGAVPAPQPARGRL